MLDSIISSSEGLTLSVLFVCSVVSILLGLVIALIHKHTSRCTKNFLITLAIIPVLVQTVIFMTSGNLGATIATVGAFSLVRFRSLPGTSKEIISVFFAVVVGLAMGIGQIAFAVIMTFLVGLVIIVLSKTKFGNSSQEKILKVVLPEDMDYETVFDEVFKKYLTSYRLESVKTINLGSLFELTYVVNMKKDISEKALIDEIRIRNGNLKVMLSHPIDTGEL